MGIEKRIHRKVGEAIRRHRMIEEGDRLLIAVSGGKDSYVLARVLADKRRYFPFPFSLVGCQIVTDHLPRDEHLEELTDRFFEELGVPLVRRFVPVEGRLDPGKEMSCFFCAMQRRMELVRVAKEQGCGKIAYGHHLDDVIETLLMNMFYKAEISTMPARLELDNHELVIVRPLSRTKESEIRTYAGRIGFRDAGQPCPYAMGGRRARVKRLVSELAREDPRVRDNLLAALGRVKLGYLEEKLR